ncbi:TetR family transcriptional regulator [Pseudomonas aeruginosa]|uniref:TetR family transcriptional regulator n=1 Tax=Pseudomonas aeruginosa TaxID=287 RepID=UPI001A2CF814|nr:TetR family transcriptional regulator [Pseudomonas aeruginosa]MBG7464643.1 TetR family transcriptional regulator [Pseudomonas aeruginosa]MDG3710735.1 TetR family transcriptional regulator [Pseudomonas aeruginosa]HBO3623440.1 TetR family transcriptional regulator [Pseudomonas aeruginosa]HCF5590248.1 TetR family transcriptional regulator [Pseudomonas aeruginosa]
MAWDTEGTKRKILAAAKIEFSRFGPDGTTVDRIAKAAGVNKERVYNYFGDKRALFVTLLRNELASTALAVPVDSFIEEDIGEYAGRIYDYHRVHPELSRLLRWESLTFENEVPDETLRQQYYGLKWQAVKAGQDASTLTSTLDTGHLIFMVIALAAWWSTMPQVARMLVGPLDDDEHARRRRSVVIAARRLAQAP